MPNSIIYRRVSTSHQDGSLEVQESKTQHYAVFRGFTVTHSFEDPDTSGSKPLAEREGGAAMLSAIGRASARGEPIEHLIVSKLDRLGRSSVDVLQTVQQLTAWGVALHIVDFGGDTLTTVGPAGKLLIVILAGVAEFEREMIRSRIQDRLDHKFAKGERCGGIPYGWDCHDGTNLTPNLEEQQWLIAIHRWRHQEGRSWGWIAKELNSRRVPTKGGQLDGWKNGNVASILHGKRASAYLAALTTAAA